MDRAALLKSKYLHQTLYSAQKCSNIIIPFPTTAQSNLGLWSLICHKQERLNVYFQPTQKLVLRYVDALIILVNNIVFILHYKQIKRCIAALLPKILFFSLLYNGCNGLNFCDDLGVGVVTFLG